MVIFHGYVSLPEGISYLYGDFPWLFPLLRCSECSEWHGIQTSLVGVGTVLEQQGHQWQVAILSCDVPGKLLVITRGYIKLAISVGNNTVIHLNLVVPNFRQTQMVAIAIRCGAPKR